MLRANVDRFTTLGEVSEAIREEGLRRCGLIFGIDYTMSNKVQGEKTFGGRSLHDISEDGDELNPYQEVITILGETLQPFDDDGMIPAFGFGDIRTKGDSIFSLKEWGSTCIGFREGSTCIGFREVLCTYNKITPSITLHRPTNFGPLIDKAVEIVKRTKKYHILVVVADGQVNNEDHTAASIVEASNYPLSIIVVGVGDGPWGIMKEFDQRLPKRKFDNFQFFSFNDIMESAKHRKAAFALHSLMEIPDQIRAIKELNLFENLELQHQQQQQQ